MRLSIIDDNYVDNTSLEVENVTLKRQLTKVSTTLDIYKYWIIEAREDENDRKNVVEQLQDIYNILSGDSGDIRQQPPELYIIYMYQYVSSMYSYFKSIMSSPLKRIIFKVMMKILMIKTK